MLDEVERVSGLTNRPPRSSFAAPAVETEDDEVCGAFGYLRGQRDRSLGIEFRFRDGNSEMLSYSLFAGWRYNPSVGLLLKFTSDIVTLVLIKGSNLAATVNGGATNLTDRGIQRHRVTWVREMSPAELKGIGNNGPTIDRIEVGEFETKEEQAEWLGKAGPVFVR